MTVMDIVRQVPVWVPFLFVFLLVLGMRARHRREMPVVVLYLIPLLSLLSLATLRGVGAGAVAWGVFALFAGLGAVLGNHAQRNVIIARHGGRVELAGEHLTLALLMGIFACNFTLRMLSQTAPNLVAHPAVIPCFAAVIGVVSGMFIGRAWAVFRTAG